MSFFTRFSSRKNKFFLHLHCNIHKGNYTWNCTENVHNSHSKWNWECFCWNERCISISKLYHRGESFVSCSMRGYMAGSTFQLREMWFPFSYYSHLLRMFFSLFLKLNKFMVYFVSVVMTWDYHYSFFLQSEDNSVVIILWIHLNCCGYNT